MNLDNPDIKKKAAAGPPKFTPREEWAYELAVIDQISHSVAMGNQFAISLFVNEPNVNAILLKVLDERRQYLSRLFRIIPADLVAGVERSQEDVSTPPHTEETK